MPKVHHVKSARKDNPVARIGQPYYWWKFPFSPKRYSASPPRRSQLTQSEFLAAVYDIEDEINNYEIKPTHSGSFKFEESKWQGSLDSVIEEWVERVRELAGECEERLSAMPEHLQDSSASGQLLTERISDTERWADELESMIGFDIEPDYSECDNDSERFAVLFEAIMGLLDEIKNITYQGE